MATKQAKTVVYNVKELTGRFGIASIALNATEKLPLIKASNTSVTVGDRKWSIADFAKLVDVMEKQAAEAAEEAEAKRKQAEDEAQAASQSAAQEADESAEVQRLRELGIGDPPELSRKVFMPRDLAALRELLRDMPGDCFIALLRCADMQATKHYAAYLSRSAGVDMAVIRKDTGEIIGTYYGRGTPMDPSPDRTRETPRAAPIQRKRVNGSGELSGMAKEAFALATSKAGAKRTQLTALNDGVIINWKGYVEALGKKRGYMLRVDKNGETPIYYLEKP